MEEVPKRRRAKGQGAIVLIGKNFYFRKVDAGKAQVTRIVDENGKPVREKRKAAKRAAELFGGVVASQTVEAVAAHVTAARLKAARRTCLLSEAWRIYEASPARPRSSPGTMGNYKRNWGKFVEWLASEAPEVKFIADVRHGHAEQYASHLWSGGMSAVTYNYHIQSCRLVLRILTRQSGLAVNPFLHIRREDEKKISRKSFTEDEVLKVLEAAADKECQVMHKEQMEVLIHILAWTGLRLADAAALTWDSITSGLIEVEPRKTRRTGRRVRIPVHPELARRLEKAQEWKDKTGRVVPTVAERYTKNKDGVIRDVQKIIEHSGLAVTVDAPDGARRLKRVCVFGAHSFRHTLASFLAARGIPISVLADVTGDNIRTLERYYIHTEDGARRDAIAALPSPSPSAIGTAPKDAERLAMVKVYIETADVPEEVKRKVVELAGA